ncbi:MULTISPECIES: helix-turn-helix domain-containing protein [Bacteroides]|uniref:helix-turn-helix domain-containing protein n=1 Tax=Bacteroides TaxID=816 RepID=UPI00202EDAD1|nr:MULTISPECIES: helix-turn-helix domain-containing protein [Bacteroides]MCM0301283.1 helix-turn-helix domain-containing protein [Bacteroides fragilis]MCM0315917.1 helix-turn-helix domain-containing protein [Bacteroides fragilis]MDV6195216.1 helix-turn-helix domain-containing protein [Bacteroides hominis (ex Liu et al. 2022)]
MRSKQEIKHAAAVLRKKGDATSLSQAAILEERRTEAWVFEQYVTNVSEERKDESAFFAARDAARFVAGRLTLEELVPDADQYPVRIPEQEKQEHKKVSYQEFEAMRRRMKLLEGLVDELCKERRQRAEYQKKPETNRGDFISAQAATEYVGCSRETLNDWQRKGYITGYRKAGRVYYSKSELESSARVQTFRTIRETKDKEGRS